MNIKLKYKYRDCYLKSGCLVALSKFRELRAIVKKDVSKAYSDFITHTEQTITSDPKHFWSFIQSKSRRSRIPGQMFDESGCRLDTPTKVVNGFSSYFSSVYLPSFLVSDSQPISNNVPSLNISFISENQILEAIKKLKSGFVSGHDQVPSFLVKDCSLALCTPLFIIFNLILKTSCFPTLWKLTKLCPVLKSGNTSAISNYRPIAILSNFAKVFEMVLYSMIYPHVKNYIYSLQHGYLKNKSTLTNLVCFTQYVSDILDSHGQVDVIYTDMSKAFDRIHHNLLLSKLQGFGFSDSLLALISSYITNRQQFVSYNGVKSNAFNASSGVPQGSNLGPLLFLLFMNDLCEHIDCEMLLYADDMKLFFEINSDYDCHHLQNQLSSFETWCGLNHLTLNVSKCKILTYTLKKSPLIFPYKLNGNVIERTHETRDLGVTFDSKLSFAPHVNDVVSSALRLLGFIVRGTRSFASVFALETLFCSLIRSRLEYCSVVWNPYYITHIDKLENVQRKFLKHLCFKVDRCHPPRGLPQSLYLARFQLQSLHLRRFLSGITFLYKLLHGSIDCPSLLSLIYFKVPRLFNRGYLTLTYSKIPKTNILVKSPIYSILQHYNRIGSSVDINHDSLKTIITFAVDHFDV